MNKSNKETNLIKKLFRSRSIGQEGTQETLLFKFNRKTNEKTMERK